MNARRLLLLPAAVLPVTWVLACGDTNVVNNFFASPQEGGAVGGDATVRGDTGGGTAETDGSKGPDAAGPQPDGAPPDAAPEDDVCPSKVDMNCSTSCAGPSACTAASCAPGVSTPLYIYDGGTAVVRTPSAPASASELLRCVENCSSPVYVLAFRVATLHGIARVQVEPPWSVVGSNLADSACSSPAPGCVSLQGGGGFVMPVMVFTRDPNAPARNVTVEDTTTPCGF